MTAKNTKILLADDEEGIRRVLGISLKDSGYDVLTAENGEEALQIFRQAKPAIVLTDIKMPGIDGIELLQKIKQEEPHTEVIMITGHGDMDLAIKSLKFEATDFVTKPINDDVLEIALKRAHEKIELRRQLKAYTEDLEGLVIEQSARLVEAERQAAVGQAVEGLSAAIRDIAGDLDGGIRYFNEMPCYVSVHNSELKVVVSNQLYKDRLADRVGVNSWEIYQGADRQKNCPVAKTFQTGMGQRSREIISYSDGSQNPVIVYTAPIRNKNGRLELVLEISADISEIERLQEELRTTQHKYQQLFDEVPCYITVQDSHYNITASNRQFKEDFGENVGSPCYATYKFRDQPCEDCPVAKTFKDGKSHQTEMMVTAKSGEQHHVLINTSPIYNAGGGIEQVMEMSADITEIRQLQDRLSSLGLMVSSISHGVKGILTGLDGGLYLLNSGLADNRQAQIEEGLDIVKQMVERIRQLVLDILYYAKERPLDWAPVDIAKFIENIIAIVAPKLKAQPVKFTKDLSRLAGKIEIDAGLVTTAISNIIENAIEACIEDSSKESLEIVFKVMLDKEHLVCNVIDNGVGMSQETKDNMFNLFYSSKGKLGTGIGLFFAKQIIQQHGGSIEVDSTLGVGSDFRIILPRVLPQSAKEGPLEFHKENA
jgi:PAS domain S-box-containing protein